MINILIVEDAKPIQNFLQEHVDKLKFTIVAIYDSAEQAIQFLQKEPGHKVDLILLDNHLSGKLSGAEVAEFLQESLKPGVIFFSGEKSNENIQKLEKFKPLAYLLKPTTALQLNITLQFAYKNLQLRLENASQRKKNEEQLQALETFVEYYDKPIILLESSKIKKINPAGQKFFSLQEEKELNEKYFYTLLPDFQTNGVHSVVYFESQIGHSENHVKDNFELLLKRNAKEELVEIEMIKLYSANENYILIINEIESNLLKSSTLLLETKKLKQIFNEINLGIFLIETRTFHIVEANATALFLCKATIDKLKKNILKDIFDSESVKRILQQSPFLLREASISTFDSTIKVFLSQSNIILLNQNFLIVSFGLTEQSKFLEKKEDDCVIQKKYEKLINEKKSFDESLTYAMRIQSALLPSSEYLQRYLNDYFLYWKPKNIVSGDFYWANYHNGNFYFAIGDATGHGVPGAFMSILGMSFLNEIVNELEKGKASLILDMLRNKIIKTLHQKTKFGEIQDGFDMSLLIINAEKKRMQFSGANMSFFMLRNDKVVELKGDRMPIGIHPKAGVAFTNHMVRLEKSDKLYLYSDGIIDQFGGEKNKKLTLQKFTRFINENNHQTMQNQYNLWSSFISEWMKDEEQTDDMLLVGIEL